jgi:hypothetical protein
MKKVLGWILFVISSIFVLTNIVAIAFFNAGSPSVFGGVLFSGLSYLGWRLGHSIAKKTDLPD